MMFRKKGESRKTSCAKTKQTNPALKFASHLRFLLRGEPIVTAWCGAFLHFLDALESAFALLVFTVLVRSRDGTGAALVLELAVLVLSFKDGVDEGCSLHAYEVGASIDGAECALEGTAVIPDEDVFMGGGHRWAGQDSMHFGTIGSFSVLLLRGSYCFGEILHEFFLEFLSLAVHRESSLANKLIADELPTRGPFMP